MILKIFLKSLQEWDLFIFFKNFTFKTNQKMDIYTISESVTKSIIGCDSDWIYLQFDKDLNQNWSSKLKSLTDTISFLSWQKHKEEPLSEIECYIPIEMSEWNLLAWGTVHFKS